MFNKVSGTVTEIGPEKKRSVGFVQYEYVCIKNEAGQNKRIEGLMAYDSTNEFLALGNTGEFFLYTNLKSPVLLGVGIGGKFYYPRADLYHEVRSQKIMFLFALAFGAVVAGLAFYFNNESVIIGTLLIYAVYIPFHFYTLNLNKKLGSDKTLAEMQKNGFGDTYESI